MASALTSGPLEHLQARGHQYVPARLALTVSLRMQRWFDGNGPGSPLQSPVCHFERQDLAG
jgi:hypothetical protein